MMTKPDTTDDVPVVLARIGAAHGLKGEVRVTLFAEDPDSLVACGPLSLPDGRTLEVVALKAAGKGVVARFREIADRTAAEALNGLELSVPRARLPEPEDDDDFYWTDLVGLSAVEASGAAVGTVIAVHDFGAGDILELRLPSGKTVMIPFSKAAVPVVDVGGGKLVVEPVAAGLADAPDTGAP